MIVTTNAKSKSYRVCLVSLSMDNLYNFSLIFVKNKGSEKVQCCAFIIVVHEKLMN